jgi:cytochrome c
LEAHKGQKWDPETLNQWLNNPQQFAPGTKMTFAGFPKAEDRADVIAYLQSLK